MGLGDFVEALEEGAEEAADTVTSIFDGCVNAGQEALADMFVWDAMDYTYNAVFNLSFDLSEFLNLCFDAHESVADALSDTVYEVGDEVQEIADETMESALDALAEPDI